MVKHVILWKLKDELAGEEKEAAAQEKSCPAANFFFF